MFFLPKQRIFYVRYAIIFMEVLAMKYTINTTKSINETLKSMKDGDTLFLENGVYKEKVVILINNITIDSRCTSNDKNNDKYKRKRKKSS